jgi:transcriptional regulator with XRE-family HTH domain
MKSKQINKLLAANLKRLRKRAGLTQEKMAEVGGFSYKYLQEIEAGRASITIKTLSRFTEILKVHPVTFFQLPRSKKVASKPVKSKAA